MDLGPQLYEYYLRRYSEIYFLIGKLEFLLRTRIVATLGNFAQRFGYREWYEVVPSTQRNREAIAFAKLASQGFNLEEYLPFSFWRHLFRREYFAGLWVPSLHMVFSNISNASSKANFKVVCRYMKRANNIRNRVSHFNFINAGDHFEEVAVLEWLINAMGGPSA
jgi:hypothetical protein